MELCGWVTHEVTGARPCRPPGVSPQSCSCQICMNDGRTLRVGVPTGVISVLLMCKALCVSANDMTLQVAAKVTETSGHIVGGQAGALRHTPARLMYSICVLHPWFCALITSLVKTPAALTASEPSFVCLMFCIWGCGCGKVAQQWCVGTLVFTLCLCVFQVWMVLDSLYSSWFYSYYIFFVQIICF